MWFPDSVFLGGRAVASAVFFTLSGLQLAVAAHLFNTDAVANDGH